MYRLRYFTVDSFSVLSDQDIDTFLLDLILEVTNVESVEGLHTVVDETEEVSLTGSGDIGNNGTCTSVMDTDSISVIGPDILEVGNEWMDLLHVVVIQLRKRVLTKSTGQIDTELSHLSIENSDGDFSLEEVSTIQAIQTVSSDNTYTMVIHFVGYYKLPFWVSWIVLLTVSST